MKEISNDARKIKINITQVYTAYLENKNELIQYQGSMVWKKINNADYLYRLKGRKGNGKSLGLKSDKNIEIYKTFFKRKEFIKERDQSLKKEISRLSKLCVAYEVNRVPKITANIVRYLEINGFLNKSLTILGTNCLYAYESRVGLELDSGLLATGDLDLLFDANSKLKLKGCIEEKSLISILRKIDKSFERSKSFTFRAINKKGFMVELVKNEPINIMQVEKENFSNDKNDLRAVELNGNKWVSNTPVFKEIVISEDGFPVTFYVPDPRHFALNKLILSDKDDRNPAKKSRDYEQAIAVIKIVKEYMGLEFDKKIMKNFPKKYKNKYSKIIKNTALKPNEDLSSLGF